jgi:hypothetical protein
MARQPFVWEGQVRREILDQELAQVSDLPYSLWRNMIGAPMARPVVGRDGRPYRLRLEAHWVRRDASPIRVSLSVKRAGWSLGRSARLSFVVSDDGRVTLEPPAGAR